MIELKETAVTLQQTPILKMIFPSFFRQVVKLVF